MYYMSECRETPVLYPSDLFIRWLRANGNVRTYMWKSLQAVRDGLREPRVATGKAKRLPGVEGASGAKPQASDSCSIPSGIKQFMG